MVRDFQHFLFLAKPLIDTWGENMFSRNKLNLLYSKLKVLSPKQIEKIIESCLLEFNFAPPIQKIINLAQSELFHAHEALKSENLKALADNPCRKCKNSGWLAAYKSCDESKHLYAFKCDCLAGKHKVSGDNVQAWEGANKCEWVATYT